MSARHPSRLVLAILNRLCPDNDALRGDLLEEFHAGRSKWWLWQQVICSIVGRRAPFRREADWHTMVLGAAVLVLLSFEAVFVTNVIQRLSFGPPLPNISGYLHLASRGVTGWASDSVEAGAWTLQMPILAVLASIPCGWLIARSHPSHRNRALVAFTVSVTLCAAFTLHLPFAVQFVTTLLFIIGLLAGGSLEASTEFEA